MWRLKAVAWFDDAMLNPDSSEPGLEEGRNCHSINTHLLLGADTEQLGLVETLNHKLEVKFTSFRCGETPSDAQRSFGR